MSFSHNIINPLDLMHTTSPHVIPYPPLITLEKIKLCNDISLSVLKNKVIHADQPFDYDLQPNNIEQDPYTVSIIRSIVLKYNSPLSHWPRPLPKTSNRPIYIL